MGQKKNRKMETRSGVFAVAIIIVLLLMALTMSSVSAESKAKVKLGPSDTEKEKLNHTDAAKEKLNHTDAAKEKLNHTDAAKEKPKHSDAAKEKLNHTDAAKEKLNHTDAAKEKPKHSDAAKEKLNHTDAAKVALNPSESMSFPTERALNELIYDDGTAEDAYAWPSAGNGFAVRFTPLSYPVDILTARICFWPDDWPDSDHEEFAVYVYDDDGLGGEPGTCLAGPILHTAAAWGWCDVDIPGPGITIENGDFYILYEQRTNYSDCEGLCVDKSLPHSGRSWDYAGGSWYLWAEENYMIRCVVDDDTTDEWTYMVYLDGDNNLEGAGIDDFMEMSSVGSTSDVNIVVQFDRIPGHDTSHGDWTDCKRFHVTAGMTPTAANALIDLGECNMGDPNTLDAFVTWAMTEFPADNYALILWNHGDGWKSINNWVPWADDIKDTKDAGSSRGICVDDTDGDYLSLQETEQALTGKYVQLLGYDACLMHMVEVVYQVMANARISAGSEEVEPWDGWPYDTILADLTGTPTMSEKALGTVIVDRYMDSYGYTGTETQSAVDNSDLQNLVAAVDNLAQALINEINGGNLAQVQQARNAAAEIYYTYYIDLYHFAEMVDTHVTGAKAEAQAVMGSVGIAVYKEAHGSSVPNDHGLSIYYPRVEGDYLASYDNTAFAVDTLWDEFLKEYYAPSICGNMNVNPTSWSPTIICGNSDNEIVTVSATGGTVKGVTVSKISGPTWLSVSPTNLGDIASGSSKTFTMTASPPTETSGDFPYTVRVSNTCGTPSTRDVTGTIHVDCCGNMGVNPTSWSPTIICGNSDNEIVTVSATGGTVKGVTVSKISGPTWLSVTPTDLGDIASGSSKTFTITASPPSETSGDFPYTVRVSNTCGNPSTRDVTGTIDVKHPSETVVSIEDASAPQGATVTVPINITGVENMCGANIWLNYNKNVVIVDSVSDGDLVPLTHNIDNTAGITKMNWDTTSGMTGDFVFAYVTLKAVGNSGDTCLLDLDVKELYDCDLVEIPRTVVDGTFEVLPPLMEGDVTDLNVCVSLKDSTLIKFYLVDMATLTPDQLECADTNDDGEVTLKDSTAIKFWLVDQYPLWESPADDHMMEPVPCSVVSLARSAASTTVSIEDASVPQGETVTVPINIADVENMCGANIWLNYNKDVVIVDSVSDGALVPLTHSIDNTAGVTKINWDTTSGMTGDFVFAYVTLKAVGNPGDTCLLDLDVKELYDCVPPFNEIPHTVADGTFSVRADIVPKPDLIITEKWVCWPDNCTICYNVTNTGDGTAPECHNTALYVDGVEVAQDHVSEDLAPGESYTGCFNGYKWGYTPPSDEIKVCADNSETLDELDEDNNCLTNIWMCGDVTDDGKVRGSDGIRIFHHLTYGVPIDNMWAADVTGDDKVRGSDGIRIFHHLTYGVPLNCKCSGGKEEMGS